MQKVLFKGVKQFTSDVWAEVQNTEEVKHYLNLVRKVDENGEIVEGEAQVWFGTRLYADLGGERIENIEKLIETIIETLGVESGGTIGDSFSGTTYITSATTIVEALETLDEKIKENHVEAGNGIIVTPGQSGTTVSVKLAENEQILSFLGDGSLHADVRIKKVDTPSGDTFAAQYQLVDKDGNPISESATIDVIKDQFLKRVLLTPVFETVNDIDVWCSANTVPDYAKAQMEIDNSYLVFEWELDFDEEDVDKERYTVIPVKTLISALEVVVNGVTGVTEDGVTTITIYGGDINIERDVEYLESIDDSGATVNQVAVEAGTDITTAMENILKVSLLYITGNDVE